MNATRKNVISPLADAVMRVLDAQRRGGFNPTSLFVGGFQGWWYDFSDMSTLFQDSAGTTPVTAVEQPIGLVLDKRLPVGAEVVVPTNTTAGWATTSATIAVVGGEIELTATAIGVCFADLEVVSSGAGGKNYRALFTCRNGQASGVMYGSIFGGTVPYVNAGSSQTNTSVRIHKTDSDASGARGIRIRLDSTAIGQKCYFSSIKYQEVLGNHSIQATGSKKPTLSARKNLYTKSEDLTAVIWTTAGTPPTITANATIAPDGTTTADQLAFSATGSGNRIQQFSPASYSGAMVVSIYLKGAVGGEAIRLWDGQSTTTVCTLTTEWQRFQVTATYSALSANCLIYANSGTPTIFAWGAQLESGSVATSYQWIDTASSYNSAGFPHYARFDGVDDALGSAASVDFTAGDALFCSIGLMKYSDAAIAGVVELSVDSNANNGAFTIRAPSSPTTARYYSSVRGSVQNGISTSLAEFDAFDINVLSGVYDISADQHSLRIAGVEVANGGGADLGTGNFGNYPFYHGSRAGTGLYFNGSIGQSVAVFKTASATEITNSEAFISKKLGLS